MGSAAWPMILCSMRQGLIMLDMSLCCFVKRFTLWNFKSLYLNPVWIRFILNINFKSALVNKAFQYGILVQVFYYLLYADVFVWFFFSKPIWHVCKNLEKIFSLQLWILDSFKKKIRIFSKCNYKIWKKKVIDLPLAQNRMSSLNSLSYSVISF